MERNAPNRTAPHRTAPHRNATQRNATQRNATQRKAPQGNASWSSWWSLGLEDDIICASYMWVREWLCRPVLELQSRAQSGHWKFAFVAGIQAAKWRRSLADCAWWRRSSSSADDADCESVRQRCLSRAVATSSVVGMSHHCKPAFTVSLKRLQGRPCLLWPCSSSPNSSCFGIRWSSILITWPVKRRQDFSSIASMEIQFVLLKTSVFVALSCHRIPRMEGRALWWNLSSCFKCRLYTVQVSQP